jgi:hypothetical protein
MIQIHREDSTTMLQLDGGARIFAAVAHNRQQQPCIVVGCAVSLEEFTGKCDAAGLTVLADLAVDVVEVLELEQEMPFGTRFIDFASRFDTIH